MSFAHVLAQEIQKDQRERYDDVMHSLNMSAAMTAKMTKEFRSSPFDQAATIVKFKQMEDENESPIRESQPIRHMLWNFHNDMMIHCGETMPKEEIAHDDEGMLNRIKMMGKNLYHMFQLRSQTINI